MLGSEISFATIPFTGAQGTSFERLDKKKKHCAVVIRRYLKYALSIHRHHTAPHAPRYLWRVFGVHPIV